MGKKELATVAVDEDEQDKLSILDNLKSYPSKVFVAFSFIHSPAFRPLISTKEGRNTLALSLVLVLYYLSFYGYINQLLTYLFHDSVYAFNSAYLASASSDSIKTLEVVASIKAVLELLRSVSGGVSFIVDIEVQLGESLSVLRDITERAWTVSLSSVAAANAISLINSSVFSVLKPVMAALFLVLGLYLGLKNLLPGIAKRVGRLITPCIFLVVFTHLIVPLSIYATAKISNYHLQSQKQELHSQLSGFSDGLPQHTDKTDLKDQVSAIREHFQTNLLEHINSTGDYSLMAIKHVLYTGAEFVFLPLAFILFSSIIVLILLRKIKTSLTHSKPKDDEGQSKAEIETAKA